MRENIVCFLVLSFFLFGNVSGGGYGKSLCGGEYYGEVEGKLSAFKYDNSGYNNIKISFHNIKVSEQSLGRIYTQLDSLSYQQGISLLEKIETLGKEELGKREKNIEFILKNNNGEQYINNIENQEKDLALSMFDNEYVIKACDDIQGFSSEKDFINFKLLGYLNIIIGNYFDNRLEDSQEGTIKNGTSVVYLYTISDEFGEELHSGTGTGRLSGVWNKYSTLRYNSAWNDYGDNGIRLKNEFGGRYSFQLDFTDLVGEQRKNLLGRKLSGTSILLDSQMRSIEEKKCSDKFKQELTGKELNELQGFKLYPETVIRSVLDRNNPEYQKCIDQAKSIYDKNIFYEIEIL